MNILIVKKATLVKAAVLTLLAIGTAVYLGAAAGHDNSAVSAATGGSAVCRADTEEKLIALTFDTAFGEDQTGAILAALKDRRVPATFAVMGLWAQENVQTLQNISDAGCAIISHSMAHERYVDMEAEKIKADADAAAALIELQTGQKTPYIRPPYGAMNESAYAALTGYIPVRWSIDSGDWREEGGESVKQRVLDGAAPGAIVLMQNNSADTAAVLGDIIDGLHEMGYTLVTIPELLPAEDHFIDIEGVWRKSPSVSAEAS